ncbi:hypothetical protein [Nocardia bovistercoris]|uniref:Uncharacterized protein n=1 Tax=Nocardia bovistercoris TaxID=2785916 RepID=A0A931IJ23_9NOCA|nr:hypothetical protein [Nocardia bovistercoris]MBH0781231.1 hypothetical protein [Nocardia bovistercoris]
MSEIEYVFGTGDGEITVWSSEADLDLARTGTSDAVRLDFDGDGLADDALWDPDGSGVADIAALDLDDDGLLDHFYTDPSGLGTWEHRITGSPEDAEREPLAWIVRTDPVPDAGPESNKLFINGLTDVLSEYPVTRPESAVRPWDADELMEHTGPLPDQRGRLLEGSFEADDRTG